MHLHPQLLVGEDCVVNSSNPGGGLGMRLPYIHRYDWPTMIKHCDMAHVGPLLAMIIDKGCAIVLMGQGRRG